ncbi:hypothetical protein ACET3X_005018 [Alternaria dauci]|uniref:Uncharacterized protein n=1 Tax=Alternaria dauci TaxID=48095 RepID=A0ABR3UJ33_9PLEO
MDGQSILDEYTADYNEAWEAYKADRLEECESKLRELLDDVNIPSYHRIKSMVLLGSIQGDWWEAYDYYLAATAQWKVIRGWHPEGDSEADEPLADLRESLEDLDRVLKEENPDEYSRFDPALRIVAEDDTRVEDAAVEEAREWLGDMDIDDDDEDEHSDMVADTVRSVKSEADKVQTPNTPVKKETGNSR